jgi:glycosyltransferase 2 family protein
MRVQARDRAPALPFGGDGASPPTLPRLRVLVRGVAALAALALAVGVVLTWRLGDGIRWSTGIFDVVPLLVLLAAGSQGLRFLRWHSLICRRVPALPVLASARIYLTGFALELTPGRVAAFLKFALVRQATGVPEAETVGVLPVEAATEVVSYLAISLAAAMLGDYRLPPLGWGVIVAFLGLVTLALLGPGRQRLQRFSGPQRQTPHLRWLRSFLQGLLAIGGPGPLLVAFACALAARACEVVLFRLATGAVGLHLTLAAAALAWGASGLAGGLSMLPGGVGAAEGAIVATVVKVGGGGGPALAAALLSRAVTLWIWIPVGLACAVASTRAPGPPLRQEAAYLHPAS